MTDPLNYDIVPTMIAEIPYRKVEFNEQNQDLVMYAFSDPRAVVTMAGRVRNMLETIHVPHATAETTAFQLTTDLAKAPTAEAAEEAGAKWNHIFEERGYAEDIEPLFLHRNKWVADLISPHLTPGTVLDHDAGDSYVANHIQQDRPDVTVYTDDSTDFREHLRDLPFTLYDYDTKHLPFEDGFFDQALMVTVLHHSDAPEKQLHEVIRTVKQGGQIFMFENTFQDGDRVERNVNVAFDWLFNKVFHRSGLALPFSHFSPKQWDILLDQAGIDVQDRQTLGFHPAIPLEHILYRGIKR